ncbi:formylglycine-generating enzyme family protein [Zavarzinia compransoris]|uniref:formylglycine-generating enzyme family protein n=1 Tax=Zavarzinia marina TaxID=2911065 RepID=UPI001F3951A6|nr:formylglycine-generating enzyme family protein [Zavarzinia marina]MCF4165027.1 formylglycine-generating enzyme family protein [Zavarzinia marina]
MSSALHRLLLAAATATCAVTAALAAYQRPTPADVPAPGQCLPDVAMPDPGAPRRGMVRLAGGAAILGASPLLPEEGPPRRVTLDPFWIDPTDVTNAQFAAFVAATGYVTRAERGPAPSSLVFVGARESVDLNDPGQWWAVVPGADWRHPGGPDTSIEGMAHLPVVHVAYEDALAYARWLGRDLPTEAEWEYAARGGLEGATFAWGETRPGDGTRLANTWQGVFPLMDMGTDGYKARPSPVGCFPANGFGLYDMAGNVWQWTRDRGAAGHVVKGGSFLCSDNYCFRYRPGARSEAASGDGTSHIGFRTVYRDGDSLPQDREETQR